MKIYRIFLPRFYNDGIKIPITKISKITDQVRERFGAYTLRHASLPIMQKEIMKGVWTSGKKIYDEQMFMIELFVEDTFKNKRWLKAFKEIICQELNQKEIFIITQDAEILSDDL